MQCVWQGRRDFLGWQIHLGLPRYRFRRRKTLVRLLLRLWCIVVNTYFVYSYETHQNYPYRGETIPNTRPKLSHDCVFSFGEQKSHPSCFFLLRWSLKIETTVSFMMPIASIISRTFNLRLACVISWIISIVSYEKTSIELPEGFGACATKTKFN